MMHKTPYPNPESGESRVIDGIRVVNRTAVRPEEEPAPGVAFVKKHRGTWMVVKRPEHAPETGYLFYDGAEWQAVAEISYGYSADTPLGLMSQVRTAKHLNAKTESARRRAGEGTPKGQEYGHHG